MSKKLTELFLELAQPDDNGVSRWVYVSEFTGKYKDLVLGNGSAWCRKDKGELSKKYIIVFDKKKTKGNSIDAIKLDGFNNEDKGTQYIRKDIKDYYKKKKCIINGTSKPEVDHKNGRKNDPRVMNPATQIMEDFQPLSKAANDAKRQHCKNCKKTGIRYDAKQLGYSISYISGNEKHNGKVDGCIGCYWYDPVYFRSFLKPDKGLSNEAINKIDNLDNSNNPILEKVVALSVEK